VRRHSKSDSASVVLRISDDRLLLEIRDEGIGFDPDCVPNERFGLRGIRERARLFGGLATIDAGLGKGTRITVELPAK
jgi:signal transduction histidine kinase